VKCELSSHESEAAGEILLLIDSAEPFLQEFTMRARKAIGNSVEARKKLRGSGSYLKLKKVSQIPRTIPVASMKNVILAIIRNLN
jgi:hypothetical protein